VTVVDASAVIEMLLRTPLGERCREHLLVPNEILSAPCLMDIEVAQVLRRYAVRSQLSADRGAEALRDLADLPLVRYLHEPLLERVWELRDSLSAYDAVYVALAEALDARLVTCDGRVSRAHGHHATVEVLE
jgi:predicted nucleic acid-binding protein